MRAHLPCSSPPGRTGCHGMSPHTNLSPSEANGQKVSHGNVYDLLAGSTKWVPLLKYLQLERSGASDSWTDKFKKPIGLEKKIQINLSKLAGRNVPNFLIILRYNYATSTRPESNSQTKLAGIEKNDLMVYFRETEGLKMTWQLLS